MVTVSAVCPLLKHILEEIVAVSSSDCSLVKEMKETISDDLTGLSQVPLMTIETAMEAVFWGNYGRVLIVRAHREDHPVRGPVPLTGVPRHGC